MKYLSEKEQRAKKLEVFEMDDDKEGADGNGKKTAGTDRGSVRVIVIFLKKPFYTFSISVMLLSQVFFQKLSNSKKREAFTYFSLILIFFFKHRK